jgi:hypothetical protein
MKSDLANAATILNIDQISNDSFPANLTLANGGKGITPSQTMDSIIYVPDNTSNPKNFCLQYRKGANNYAVDSNSAVSSGVCLRNLVTNGDFSSGTTGWTASGGTRTAVNNELTLLATAQYGKVYQLYPSMAMNHKYFFKVKVKATSNLVKVVMADDTNYGSYVTTHSGSGNYETLSGIGTTATAVDTTKSKFCIRDTRTSGWDNVYVKEYVVLDLTALFGSGNEPDYPQMNAIMNNYPSWFNVVAKANL